MLRRILFPLIIMLLFPILSWSVETGEGAYRFLNLPSSARLAGLGGDNVSAQAGDVNQIYSNPSSFTPNMRNAISLSYVNYLADANGGQISYAFTHDSLNYFGFNFLFMGYGDLDGYDKYGEQTGDFSAADFAWNLVYARYLGAGIQLGASIKPVYSHIDIYNSFALAFSVGATYYKPEWDFSVGFVATDFGVRFSDYYDEQDRERMPCNLKLGISKGLQHAPFRFSMTYHHLNRWNLDYDKATRKNSLSLTDGKENSSAEINGADMFFRHVVFGVEILVKKVFHFDIAYNHRRNREYHLMDTRAINGFSFGTGFKVYKFNLDAAYAQYAPKGGTFTLSLSTSIDSFKK